MTSSEEAGRPPILRTLRVLCGFTAVYDLALGITLIVFLKPVGTLLRIDPPTYPDNAQLNGTFLIAVGIGYVIVMRRMEETLWYLWVMGVFLHLLGAAILFSLFCSHDSSVATRAPQVNRIFPLTCSHTVATIQ